MAEDELGPIRIEWEGRAAVDWIAVLKDIIAYILFMNQQIPQPLDQLEYNTIENTVIESHGETSSLPSERRERNRKARAAKSEMKKREKLKGSIRAVLAALEAAFKALTYMPSLLLILGSSTKQPFAAYDIQFHRISPLFSGSQYDNMDGSAKGYNFEIMTKTLSKKITRALVSQDTGPLFTGPMKLFLFVKANATTCMPQDFVPRRGYTTRSRKTQAHLRMIQIISTSPFDSKGDLAPSTMEEDVTCCNEMIWFQCKWNVKGGQCHDIV